MNIAEEMVCATLNAIVKNRAADLQTLNITLDVPTQPFPRITYDEVVDMLATYDTFSWGDDLGSEEEKIVGENIEELFYFITKYPLATKPFYAMPTEDQRYARAFDLAFNGIEIASGAQRIHHPTLLEQRLSQLGMNVDHFADYLKAFHYGIPPHGGFGFGIERFLMELLNLGNIRECILFPRDKKRLSP